MATKTPNPTTFASSSSPLSIASRNIQTVTTLLLNATDPATVTSLTTPSLTYTSLSHSNPALHLLMPWAGHHPSAGPAAILDTFTNVSRHWETLAFTIETSFASADGANVQLHGSFTYRSRVLRKEVTSLFAVWAQLDPLGKVSYVRFLEDTFATAASFESTGEKVYRADSDGHEVVL